MEFIIFDAKSANIPGPRWHVSESNGEVEIMKFTSLKKAKEWLTTRGFTFKPSICCWIKKEV